METGDMGTGVQLNFINNSNDQNNSDVVIFQKNVAASDDELAVAWLVIQNCGIGDNHPFVFPQTMQVGVSDSWGNFTPRLIAQPGQAFAVENSDSGAILVAAGAASCPTEVQVHNNLQQGAIDAWIYRNDWLLATRKSIAPGQMAAFQFDPTIWIGAVSQVEQGEVMNSAITQSINTELSLLGIASADIVMTGGGSGPDAQPFVFSLQNIVRA